MRRPTPRAAVAALLLAAAGCASQRPVLYHNAQYERAGEDGARTAIAACEQQAQELLDDPGPRGEAARRAARDTAIGAAGGAAGGAVWGAIRGGAGSGAAAGAAGGAATGLVVSLVTSAFTPSAPDPTYRALVDRCLVEQGYEPVGWR